MIRLRLLGAPGVEIEGKPAGGVLKQRQRIALLALLAARGRAGVRRDRVLAYLWPDRDAERARHALSQTLYSIRQALGEGAIVSMGDGLQLDNESLWVDTEAFERALSKGDLEAAVDLYGGPFLEGFHLDSRDFEQFLDSERDRLAERYRKALISLAEGAADEGRPREAAGWWRKATAHDPHSSRLAVSLMQSLAAAGEPAAALQHAKVHAQLLESQLESRPDAAVEAIAAEIRAGMESGSPIPHRPRDAEAAEMAEPAETDARPKLQVEREPDVQRLTQRIVQWAIAYVAGAWLLVEVLGFVAENFGWPAGIVRGAAVFLGIGFFVALVLAWHHGEKGQQRVTGFKLLIIAGLLLVAGAAVAYVSRGSAPEESETELQGDAPVANPPNRLAVLPLLDMSDSDRQEFFADAMTEMLTAELARISALGVTSRTSASRYRNSDLSASQIADELAVDALVEGSVLRDGERVRITVQLIGTEPERHLWAESYEGTMRDIIGLQRQAARAIAASIEIALGPDEKQELSLLQPRDPLANEAYLKGIYQLGKFNEPGVRQAIAFFGEAVAVDSTFADAWAGLASSYWLLTQPMLAIPHVEGMPLAKAAAERALELDSRSAWAETTLGWVALFYDWDWDQAERHFARAIALQPGAGLGYLARGFLESALGDHESAIADLRQAVELDPLSLANRSGLAEVLIYAGRTDEAHVVLNELLEFDPDYDRARGTRRWLAEMRGDWEGAHELLHERWLVFGGSTASEAERAIAEREVPATREGYWRWRLDLLRQWDADGIHVNKSSYASIYAWLGDLDAAFDYLDQAFEAREGPLALLRHNPRWTPLRGDPRFDELSQRVGLPLK